MATTIQLAELPRHVGQEVGASDWLEVTQEMIDTFAEATGDHQWIHVDPERAAAGPFGTTIAHGFLTISLLPRLVPQTMNVEGVGMGVNYGLNKVRFPAPVPVGSRIRAVVRIGSVDELDGGAMQLQSNVTIEIDGGAKPACVAEFLVRYLPA